MKVQVKLFAAAKDLAGRDTLEVELSAGGRIADLRAAMIQTNPALADIMPHTLFALDAEYANDDTIVIQKMEVACIPPVSGG